jgi:hypothetical protein
MYSVGHATFNRQHLTFIFESDGSLKFFVSVSWQHRRLFRCNRLNRPPQFTQQRDDDDVHDIGTSVVNVVIELASFFEYNELCI